MRICYPKRSYSPLFDFLPSSHNEMVLTDFGSLDLISFFLPFSTGNLSIFYIYKYTCITI